MRRRFSQRALAAEASSTARHIGDLELGRDVASQEMLVRLAEVLRVPIRDRNALLTAAGYTPLYTATGPDDPGFPRQVLDWLLGGAEPNPAIVVDGHWSIRSANAAASRLFAGAEPLLSATPENFLRLCLHPAGLAPRIVNLREWRAHTVDHLRARLEATGDPKLSDLLEEIYDYPLPRQAPAQRGRGRFDTPVVPLRLVTIDGTLNLMMLSARFWPAVDAAMSELSIKTFLPADAETRAILDAMGRRTLVRGGKKRLALAAVLNASASR